jgi:hypothetical protein
MGCLIMSKIFVQIASYRDRELLPTLDDCISKATNPENLVFSIAWQHAEEEEDLDKYKNDSRFKIIDIPFKESKGTCWARHKIQQNYNDEEYTLQLDSHHRFSQGWDSESISIIKNLQEKGHKKPILTSYLPCYFPDKQVNEWLQDPWLINIERFLPQGPPFLRPAAIQNYKELTEPCPSRFLSGHFVFTVGSFIKDVPYDPDFYFHGEETSLAIRAFTHGYDLFAPHKVLAWHYYGREGSPRHWGDHNTWSARDKTSYARFRALVGMDDKVTEDLSQYGLGKERTLHDYQQYAGIKFSTRQIHQETLDGKLPPLQSDFEQGLRNKIKTCVSIFKESLKDTDYDVWVVAMLDEHGKDLFRRDVQEKEINEIMNKDANDRFIHVWVEYDDGRLPRSSRFWPHSKEKGWRERVDQVISYE